MKKWLRRFLIAAMLAALILGGLYEHSTHMGRGWLFGEAFFEGRPTSFWRGRIDRWVARHPSPADAERAMKVIQIFVEPSNGRAWWGDVGQSEGLTVNLENEGTSLTLWSQPAPTYWQRMRNLLTGNPEEDNDVPKVLNGLEGAEPVLRELEVDATRRPFVEQARRNAVILKRHVSILP